MAIEVRTVGPEAFDEIAPLLAALPNGVMSKADWRWVLFEYPWAASPPRGWALYADGCAVGFLGAVFSVRPLHGRMEKFLSPSCWVVQEQHRYAGALLLRPMLALEDHTIVALSLINLVPSPGRIVGGRIAFLGEDVVQASSERLRQIRGRGIGTQLLMGAEELARKFCEDMRASPVARHALLRRNGRRCYVVATPSRKRGVPYADLQYVGDREFFWEHRILAHAALTRAMGIAGLTLAVDRRFLIGKPPPLAQRMRMPRLYRPATEDITPAMIDGLYSEFMGIRV